MSKSDKITIVIVGTDSFRRRVTRLVHDALLENEELEGQEKAGICSTTGLDLALTNS